MSQTVAITVRYPSRGALATAWDVLKGTLALPQEAPPIGARVLVDGLVGDATFLAWGEVIETLEGERLVLLRPDGRAELEAILEPPRKHGEDARALERRPVNLPGLLSGKILVRCTDLSTGGARLHFPPAVSGGAGQAPGVGELVHLALFPPDAAAIPAPIVAHVAWRSDDGRTAGLAFLPGAARTVELILESSRRPAASAVA